MPPPVSLANYFRQDEGLASYVKNRFFDELERSYSDLPDGIQWSSGEPTVREILEVLYADSEISLNARFLIQDIFGKHYRAIIDDRNTARYSRLWVESRRAKVPPLQGIELQKVTSSLGLELSSIGGPEDGLQFKKDDYVRGYIRAMKGVLVPLDKKKVCLKLKQLDTSSPPLTAEEIFEFLLPTINDPKNKKNLDFLTEITIQAADGAVIRIHRNTKRIWAVDLGVETVAINPSRQQRVETVVNKMAAVIGLEVFINPLAGKRFRFSDDSKNREFTVNIHTQEGRSNYALILQQTNWRSHSSMTSEQMLSFVNAQETSSHNLRRVVAYTNGIRFALVRNASGDWIIEKTTNMPGGGNGGAGDNSGGMPVGGWDSSSRREIWQMSTVGSPGHKVAVSYSLDMSGYREMLERKGDVLLVREGGDKGIIARALRLNMGVLSYRASQLTPLQEKQLVKKLNQLNLDPGLVVINEEAFVASTFVASTGGDEEISYAHSPAVEEVPESEEVAEAETEAGFLARGSIVLGLPSGVHVLGQGGVLGRESPGVGVQVLIGGHQDVGSRVVPSLFGASSTQIGPVPGLVPGLVQGVIFSAPPPAQARPVVVVPALAPAN